MKKFFNYGSKGIVKGSHEYIVTCFKIDWLQKKLTIIGEYSWFLSPFLSVKYVTLIKLWWGKYCLKKIHQATEHIDTFQKLMKAKKVESVALTLTLEKLKTQIEG